MKLLAIETSTEACSVALWIDGEVHERFEIAPRRHTELVFPWADELLAEAGLNKTQLDAIAVGRGPGAFTGVRLAVALAQGIALALDKPIVPISTLAALALQAPSPAGEGWGEGKPCDTSHYLLAAIDARMGEIYLGAFAPDPTCLLRPLSEEWMATPTAPNVPPQYQWLGVGTGFSAANSALPRALSQQLIQYDASALPHAADIAQLAALAFARGEAIAPEWVEPAYLRNKVAFTMAEQALRR